MSTGDSPEMIESTNLRRDNLSREILYEEFTRLARDLAGSNYLKLLEIAEVLRLFKAV